MAHMDYDSGKDRLAAFFDAVLAIVMTILVLELQIPSTISLQGFWDIRDGLLTYFLTFFWLGALWAAHHAEWRFVRDINHGVVWSTLVLLFFTSLFPYAARLVSLDFWSRSAQGFYGIVTICTTAANMVSYTSIVRADPENNTLKHYVHYNRQMMPIDLIVKVIGLVVAVAAWPPAMMVSTLVAATLVLFSQVHHRRSSRLC